MTELRQVVYRGIYGGQHTFWSPRYGTFLACADIWTEEEGLDFYVMHMDGGLVALGGEMDCGTIRQTD